MRRLQGAAVFGAAFAAGLVPLGVVWGGTVLSSSMNNKGWVAGVLAMASVAAGMALVVAAVVWTMCVVLAGQKRLNLWSATIMGVLLSVGLTLASAAVDAEWENLPGIWLWMGLCPIAAALAGWAAWRVLQRRVKPEDTAELF